KAGVLAQEAPVGMAGALGATGQDGFFDVGGEGRVRAAKEAVAEGGEVVGHRAPEGGWPQEGTEDAKKERAKGDCRWIVAAKRHKRRKKRAPIPFGNAGVRQGFLFGLFAPFCGWKHLSRLAAKRHKRHKKRRNKGRLSMDWCLEPRIFCDFCAFLRPRNQESE